MCSTNAVHSVWSKTPILQYIQDVQDTRPLLYYFVYFTYFIMLWQELDLLQTFLPEHPNSEHDNLSESPNHAKYTVYYHTTSSKYKFTCFTTIFTQIILD